MKFMLLYLLSVTRIRDTASNLFDQEIPSLKIKRLAHRNVVDDKKLIIFTKFIRYLDVNHPYNFQSTV